MSDAIIDDNEETIIDEYDVQAILAKYNIDSPQRENNPDKVIELSEDDENQEHDDEDVETPSPPKKIRDGVEDDVDKLLKEISKKYKFDTSTKCLDQEIEESNNLSKSTMKVQSKGVYQKKCVSTDESVSDNDDDYYRKIIEKPILPSYKDHEDEDFLIEIASASNKNTKNQASQMKVVDKQQLKEQKQRERERKKEETQRNKEIKKAIQMSNKQIKPEEAVKFITANIDREILNTSFATQITHAVENLGSSWKSLAQTVPNSVTWTRKRQTHLLNDDGILTLTSDLEEADEILLLMEYQQCLDLAENGSLAVHVQEILSMYTGENNRITLGIYPVQSGRNKRDPKVSRKELEFALTELQLLCNCCHKFLESGEDVGAMVAQFTKSIAQALYKLERQEKYMQAEWYMSGDNKDCVRVDKDGNGLQRLWQQQLTSFPLARIETAEAIMSKYPTINSLMEAYSNCSSEREQEQLLQDIPIRRAAGPITNIRKIGPELSRKIATFYNSTSGTTVL